MVLIFFFNEIYIRILTSDEVAFLEKIENLSKELKDIPNTDRVISPTTIKNISLSGLAPVQKRLLHIDDPSLYKDDSIAIYNTPELIGSFFPKDAKSISIFIKMRQSKSL